ncbi:MAG: SMC family ATPase [Candidatus Thorarchaeota archaeon]
MMRLISLKLENWSCHESIEVDLSKGLQIEGRNGTGKSSILEAIRFMFQGTARGYTQRIRNGERQALVNLVFTCEGQTFTIEKTLFVDKASTALMFQGETQVADNPSSVHQRLQGILAEDILEKLLYIPQGGLTSILERLSGRDGKQEMDRLFGLDKLERIWEKTGSDIQEQEMKLNVLEDEVVKYPENADEEFNDRITALEELSNDLKEKISSESSELEKAKLSLSESETALKTMQETNEKIESLKKEKNKLMVSEAGVKKEVESIQERLKELETKKDELRSAEDKWSNLERYSRIRSILQERKSTDDKLDELKNLKEKKKKLIQLRDSLKSKPERDAEFEESKKLVSALESEYASQVAEVEKSAEYFSQLGSLNGMAKCPRCGQRLNAFVMEREKVETARRIKAFEEQRRKLEVKLESAKKELRLMEKVSNDMRTLEGEERVLSTEVGEKESKVVHLMKTISEIDTVLAKRGYKGESPDEIEAKYREWNELKGIVESLKNEVKDVTRLKKRETKLFEDMKGLRDNIKDLDVKLSSLKYDEDEHKTIKAKRDSYLDSKYRIESNLKALNADFDRSIQERKDVEQKLKDYTGLMERCSKIKKQLSLLRAAREVFHRDRGFVRYLRESFVHKLNSLLTYHFKRFNQNPRYVDVAFDKDYKILFRTTSGDLTVEQTSGGEMAQLALALRIALIDLMSPIPLLILDEPFGSLDETHRELLGESLNKISQQGQLILVTHVHVDSLHLQNRLDLGGY